MNCFILTWRRNDDLPRRTILDTLDAIPDVLNWRAAVGAIIIVSESDARSISEKINEKLPKLHFLVSPVSIDSAEGYMDKDTWNFIRRPRRVGEP
jgi:hypothetical protein